MPEAYSPTGSPIIAAADTVPGNAMILPDSFRRAADGSLDFEWAGETRMCWDGALTNERDGLPLYVAEDGTEWTAAEIRLEGEEAPPPVQRKPMTFDLALVAMRGGRRGPAARLARLAIVDGQLTRISETGAQTPWEPHPVLILADGWTIAE